MTLRRTVLPLAGAGAAALIELLLVLKLGVIGAVLPFAGLAVLVPLNNPRIALALYVGFAVLIEDQTANLIPFTTMQFTDPLPGHPSPVELLMVIAILSVLVDSLRHRRWPTRPAPFGPILALLSLCLAIGFVVGRFQALEGFNPVTEQMRPFFPLIITPWLCVNALRDRRDLRRGVELVAFLVVVKAVFGLLAIGAGIGSNVSEGSQSAILAGQETSSTITYLEPASNVLAMIFVLCGIASLASRISLGRIARWTWPIVLASLTLSLRRSFWIGTVAATPLALLIGSGRRSRRFLAPVAVILGVAVWLAVTTGITFDSNSAVGQRVSSLSSSKLSTNPQDRYRLDERKNVLAEIRVHPWFGIGLATQWTDRYPLSVQNAQARDYVHMAVLFYWLKFGILGPIAYLAYMLGACVMGITVFRRHPDERVRLAAAGFAAGMIGLMVAELTATFVGTDGRTDVIVGFGVGLLTVAGRQLAPTAEIARQLREPPPQRARATTGALASAAMASSTNASDASR